MVRGLDNLQSIPQLPMLCVLLETNKKNGVHGHVIEIEYSKRSGIFGY